VITRKQVVALTLVSFWVASTLFMWFAATRSFRTADRLAHRPEPSFARAIKPLGEGLREAALRYIASQINAVYFRFYGFVQIALGIAVVALIAWQTPRDSIGLVLAAIMLVIAVALATLIEPRIASFGRNLERQANLPARFWLLHRAYTGLDGLKLVAGIVLIVRWILMA
jgi:hypothetical protein